MRVQGESETRWWEVEKSLPHTIKRAGKYCLVIDIRTPQPLAHLNSLSSTAPKSTPLQIPLTWVISRFAFAYQQIRRFLPFLRTKLDVWPYRRNSLTTEDRHGGAAAKRHPLISEVLTVTFTFRHLCSVRFLRDRCLRLSVERTTWTTLYHERDSNYDITLQTQSPSMMEIAAPRFQPGQKHHSTLQKPW